VSYGHLGSDMARHELLVHLCASAASLLHKMNYDWREVLETALFGLMDDQSSHKTDNSRLAT